ncbi:flavodoxin domain-containing protein [Nocardia terpenica]|uniref:Flavodoxin n=1 Tax=Nocardia terpenica TaxID=455432 RepID=A0A6G9Z0R1_9NOCA|nr:flavodoxin domain-containing protein [Nocardia terpenica]QIS18961.1 flavodoxin [Nocardia terpenica]
MEPEKHRIAVIYATAQGSTRDIAEFIAAELAEHGARVEVSDIGHAPELTRFDTVVLGSAIHHRDLLPTAADYIRNHQHELVARDVWLFSVGLGPALRGPIGAYSGRLVPKKIAALRDSIRPRDYRPFAGHYERIGVNFGARVMYRVLGGQRYGDLRDWVVIRGWVTTIASTTGLPNPRSSTIHP